MPSTKDFKVTKANGAQPTDSKPHAKAKRRPGREPLPESEEKVSVVDVENGVVNETKAKSNEPKESMMSEFKAETQTEEAQAKAQGPKVEIKFSGSEVLRAKFPKTFDLAESIAGHWVSDGQFEDLPIEQPLAQYFAAKGLKKAKSIEKKVMESPTTEKVAMKALEAGMKAQEIISQVREKMKTKQ
jgi:hypothetical protein